MSQNSFRKSECLESFPFFLGLDKIQYKINCYLNSVGCIWHLTGSRVKLGSQPLQGKKKTKGKKAKGKIQHIQVNSLDFLLGPTNSVGIDELVEPSTSTGNSTQWPESSLKHWLKPCKWPYSLKMWDLETWGLSYKYP